MKGLLIKDCIVTTKQLKMVLFVIPILAIVGNMSISVFAILLGAVLPMTSIAYDEHCKWTELAVMMPYSKKDLIVSKYLLGYGCIVGATALVIIGQILAQLVGGRADDSGINMLLFAICGGLIFIAINTPIIFKFGSEKGRFVFIIAMVIAGACGPLLAGLDPETLLWLSNLSPVVLFGAVILINIASIGISMKIKPNTNSR